MGKLISEVPPHYTGESRYVNAQKTGREVTTAAPGHNFNYPTPTHEPTRAFKLVVNEIKY